MVRSWAGRLSKERFFKSILHMFNMYVLSHQTHYNTEHRKNSDWTIDCEKRFWTLSTSDYSGNTTVIRNSVQTSKSDDKLGNTIHWNSIQAVQDFSESTWLLVYLQAYHTKWRGKICCWIQRGDRRDGPITPPD